MPLRKASGALRCGPHRTSGAFRGSARRALDAGVIGHFAAAGRALVRTGRRAAVPASVLALSVAAGQTVVVIREAVLSRPLPYPDAPALVRIEAARSPDDPRAAAGFGDLVTIHEAELLRQHASSVASFAAWSETWATVGGESGRPVRVVRAYPGLLAALGVRPSLGAGFAPEDYEANPGRPPAVLLGRRLWRGLGGPVETPVTELMLNGTPTPVAGVMPADFLFPDPDAAVWVPAPGLRPTRQNRGSARRLVGRLAPGVSPVAASAELTTILQSGGSLRPDESVRVTRLSDVVTAGVRPALDLLVWGALLLTLAASVSMTALRMSAMLEERVSAATRRALGASSKDELRRALSRVVVQAVFVGAMASLVAFWLVSAARRFAGAVPFSESWGLTPAGVGLGFALALAAVTVSETPAVLAALRHPPRLVGAQPLTPGTGALASSYLAFGTLASTAMLIAAGAFSARAFDLVRGLGGYSAEGLAQLTVDFGGATRPLSHDEKAAALKRAADRLRALPGVEEVGYADALPDAMGRVSFESFEPGAAAFTEIRASPRLLQTLGLQLLRGRGLLETDDPPAEPVAVLSRSLALRQGGDPMNRMIGSRGAEARAVGVTADVLRFPAEAAPPAAYIPFAEPPSAAMPAPRAEIVARLDRAVREADSAALAREVASAAPALRILRAESVRDRRARLLGGNVLAAALVALFAAVSALLAVVGAVGLVVETAARRVRRLAILQAVGAPPDAVVRAAAGRSGWASGVGVGLGVAGGWVLLRVVGSRIAWVETGEWTLYAGPAALMGLALLAACAVTGLRALRANPWTALRSL